VMGIEQKGAVAWTGSWSCLQLGLAVCPTSSSGLGSRYSFKVAAWS
jgi:hypothetical protein